MSTFRQLVVESHSIYNDQSVCLDQTFGELIACSAQGELAYVTTNKRDVQYQSLDPSDASVTNQTLANSANINDLAFAPMLSTTTSSFLLAAGAQDGTVKLWSNGSHLQDISAVGNGAVSQVKWHPSCANLLGVSSGANLGVFDVSTAQNITPAAPTATAPIMSLAWNVDGSQLYYSTPSTKQLAMCDPRAAASPPTVVVPVAHAGTKFMTCEYAHDNEVVTCGQNSNRDREIALWDVRSGKQSLYRSRVDASQSYLRAHFDRDTGLVFFAGHGDSNVRVYESRNSTLQPIGNFTLNGASASACFAPKQLLNKEEFEINRILRYGAKSIQQVAVRIPRKPGSACEDLFPPTRSTTESLSVADYVNKRNASPNKTNLFEQGKAVEEPVVVAASPEPLSSSASPAPDAKRFSKFLGFQAKMKYNKIVQSNKDQSMFGLTPGDFPGDANLLAASSQFVAFPWKSISGGPLYIKSTSPSEFQGKLKGEPVLVQGHGDKISCIQFSEFDQTLLATGAEDATVRVYRVPAEGIHTAEQASKLVESSSMRLQGHRLGLRGLAFHRVCANLLTTFAADETIKIWDVESGSELLDLAGLPAAGNVDWSYNGNLLAVACKDSSVRLLDPRVRTTTLPMIPQTHEGLKASRVCWLDQDTLLTTGFGKTGDRQYRLWDLRKALNNQVTSYLSTSLLDPGAGVVVPTFVEDNGVVVMTAKGEMSIRVLEVEGMSGAQCTENGKYTMHKCNEFRATGDATLGLAFLPRRFVDYKRAEWLHGYRLTSSTVESLSFQVPRSQEIQGYFYDDLFPKARSGEPAIRSAKEWAQGKQVNGPLLVDLNVDKLKVLSERPAAESHQAIKRGAASVERMKREQEEREKVEREKQEALARMQRLAVQHEKYNPNLSQSGQGHNGTTEYAVEVGPSDVQDDEWDD